MNTPIVVVTSCSAQGWKSYGMRFLDTFHRFWPQTIELFVVSEDPILLPQSITSRRKVTFLSLWQLSPKALGFHQRHQTNHKARGLDAPDSVKKHGYSFRHDAYKFSKKVFAIDLVANQLQGTQRLIWLDADVVTHSPVPGDMFLELPPYGLALAYLDRGKFHSECGFVGYNLEHEATRPFIAEFTRLYDSDAVFALEEWHDSWVFDMVRRRLGTPSYPIPYRGAITHPFVYSVLGQYMDHLKGARKQRGVSHDHPKYRRDRQTFRGRGKVTFA